MKDISVSGGWNGEPHVFLFFDEVFQNGDQVQSRGMTKLEALDLIIEIQEAIEESERFGASQ